MAIDRPGVSETGGISEVPPDPRGYDGKYLTAEIERVVTSHDKKPGEADRPSEAERLVEALERPDRPERPGPWTLDTPVGKDETAGDVLRRHHFGEDSDERELPPETSKRNADYIAEKVEAGASPWLAPAADAHPLVQSVYVERDESVGHDLQRHEGWRGDQGQHDRALYQRDPHHPTDSPEYLRSNDFFGNGRLHDCWGYATHLPDPVAYATAYARIREHPRVQEVLSRPFDVDTPPKPIRDIPVEDILGPDGHAAIRGYELVGDNLKAAANDREKWMKDIRSEMGEGSSFEEAMATVRSMAAENNRLEPSVRRIESFAGGTFSIQFDANQAGTGYDILSFHASPRRVEQ